MRPRQILRWEEPRPQASGPAPGNGRNGAAASWADVIADLRARPGEWAVVLEGTQHQASSVASYIRTGQYGFGPAGSFASATRVVRPRRGEEPPRVPRVAVYARANLEDDGSIEGCWP